MVESVDLDRWTCPLPLSASEKVLLGHGSGGKLSAELIQHVFLGAWNNPTLSALEDQATIELTDWSNGNGACSARLAFTTDSYVVKPLFFPGGDIGKLAVHGTVNDLAVGGAIPKYLSAAFILEEGLPIDDLRRIVESMRSACEQAGISIVTGDTKVVDRGSGDGIFITTTGIGVVPPGRSLSAHHAKPGDRVLLSGTIGDHGITILSEREGIEFETSLTSDTAPLTGLVEAMFQSNPSIHCMRDPTRGGIASSLNEIASASRVGIRIDERSIPVRPEVHSACEMLGLDPLYVANEGKLIAIVDPRDAPTVLRRMREHPLGRDAAEIGEITGDNPSTVVLKSSIGGERFVSMLAGEQLPRIC